MNTVTFNDSLPNDVIVKTKEGIEILKSPIFLHQDLEEEILKSGLDQRNSDQTNIPLIEGIFNNPDLFPFRKMRMFLKSNSFDSVNVAGWKIWLQHKNKSLILIIQNVPIRGNYKPVYVFIGDPKPPFDGRIQGYSAMVYEGRLVERKDMQPSLQKAYADFMQGIFTSLSFFLHLLKCGSEFLVKVKPDATGKSVEWTQARTHYVLIHRSHPANNAKVTLNQKVTLTQSHLKKQAHSRRAHDRILRSEKFKHKRGQTIRIKACWVGPLEWKQDSSIYQIIQSQP